MTFLHLSQTALVYRAMAQLIETGTWYSLDRDVTALSLLYN
jgi:hypothetical protein